MKKDTDLPASVMLLLVVIPALVLLGILLIPKVTLPALAIVIVVSVLAHDGYHWYKKRQRKNAD